MTDSSTENRRIHKRINISCPITVHVSGGPTRASGRTINISNSGILLVLPTEATPAPGRPVIVRMSVPHTAPDKSVSYEEFICQGTIVRTHLGDDQQVRTAVEFTQPIQLSLEM